ncbi:MAG: adenylate/guanylate cyclase domain-containing protein [Acidobacteria bacterium]|nr:adenylate/guanylate cyclase domain-containing protein [Acidobacteriota bacterium]
MNLNPSTSNRTILKRLLEQRNQQPDRVDDIDAHIHRLFDRRAAVLVLDMSGFSRLTQEFGIIHYLAMIEQMDSSTRPAVEGNGGTVIKQEADNLFAIFETTRRAVEGALDILRAFEAVNAAVPGNRDLYGSLGIGYGDLLVIGTEDLYGDEMNLACKLGEDLANAGEILLTGDAHASLDPDLFDFERRTYETSGLTIEAHRFVRPRYDLEDRREP